MHFQCTFDLNKNRCWLKDVYEVFVFYYSSVLKVMEESFLILYIMSIPIEVREPFDAESNISDRKAGGRSNFSRRNVLLRHAFEAFRIFHKMVYSQSLCSIYP